MKNLILVLFALIFATSVYSQQIDTQEANTQSNPIIFLEGIGALSVIKNLGYSGGLELNYQTGKNLFSLRYMDVTGLTQREPSYLFPEYVTSDRNHEYAVLYGKRWALNRFSYSFSAGVSQNNYEHTNHYYDEIYDGGIQYVRSSDSFKENYIGVPFEANIKWYASKKRSKLIWNALIPSVGIKLFGNFSKNSYVGLGVSLGLGLNKTYQ